MNNYKVVEEVENKNSKENPIMFIFFWLQEYHQVYDVNFSKPKLNFLSSHDEVSIFNIKRQEQ